jgi:hypothetical protein
MGADTLIWALYGLVLVVASACVFAGVLVLGRGWRGRGLPDTQGGTRADGSRAPRLRVTRDPKDLNGKRLR